MTSLVAVLGLAAGVHAGAPLPEAKDAVYEALRRARGNLITARAVQQDAATLLFFLPYGPEKLKPRGRSREALRHYTQERVDFWRAVLESLERGHKESQAAADSLGLAQDLIEERIALVVLARKAREIVRDAEADARFMAAIGGPGTGETGGQIKARKIRLFAGLDSGNKERR